VLPDADARAAVCSAVLEMLPVVPGDQSWAGLWLGDIDRLGAWRSSLESQPMCPTLSWTQLFIKSGFWHSGR
jgi:hypothetical protein